MAAITAKQVADLRAKTGLGMMNCKNALVEADGDTYVKDAAGAYTVKITKDTESGEAYLNAIENNAKYVILRPSKGITIKSITFSK